MEYHPRRLFWSQVGALVKKDLRIMRAHAPSLLKELAFPICMSAIACMLLTNLINAFVIVQNGSSIDCSPSASSFYPSTMTFPTAMQYNSSVSGDSFNCAGSPIVAGASTEQSFFDEFNVWANASTYNLNHGTYLGYFQNGSQPLAVYEYSLYHTSDAIALGTFLNGMYNGAPRWTPNIKQSQFAIKYNQKQIFATFAALLIALSFAPMCSAMAGYLVDEKKARIREHLRIMGVSPIAYILATFTTASIRVLFVCLVHLVLLLAFNVIPDSTMLTIFWFSLLFFGFSLAAFAQILPAFVTHTTFSNGVCKLFICIGAVGGALLTLLPHEAYTFFAIFLSPAAFVFGAAQALLGHTVLVITPGGALGLLVLHVFMYGLLGQYLYAIRPGEYGVPRHPLFPVHDLIDLCRSCRQRSRTSSHLTDGEMRQISGDAALSQPASSPTSPASTDRIVLRDLVKYYDDCSTPAVNHLCLDVREKEIFCLLGHNGAGKTTTISILTGMLPATSYGTARVMGYDLQTEMHKIRLNIGSCPQFDVLFDDLSAREHLDLFAACKGQTATRADELLTKLKLPLTDQKAGTFSGGMKRRLSVAIALVGDSPLIFLDEPSSGLDPMSRRQLWELIKDEKKAGKTIILTTHFMEEADYLGDRIAIMSHGSMKCCDTSEKLKQTYGVGYYLNFVKIGDGVAPLMPSFSAAFQTLAGETTFGDEMFSCAFYPSPSENPNRIETEPSMGATARARRRSSAAANVQISLESEPSMSATARAGRRGSSAAANNQSQSALPIAASSSAKLARDKSRSRGLLQRLDTFRKPAASVIFDRYAPGWKLHHESVTETTYLLPLSALPNFGPLLSLIDENLGSFGASSYGLAMNTLEDVFVYISNQEALLAAGNKKAENDDDDDCEDNEGNTDELPDGTVVEEEFVESTQVSDIARLWSQILTVMYKKRLVMFHSMRIIFLTVILPIVIIGCGYAAVIPNWTLVSTATSSNSGLAKLSWPDTTNLKIAVCQSSNTFTDEMRSVLAKFQSNYANYHAQVNGVAATVSVQYVQSMDDFNKGTFLDAGTVSFTKVYSPSFQLRLEDKFGTLIPADPSQNIPSQMVYGYTYYFNYADWQANFMTLIESLFAAAVEESYRAKISDSTPIVLPTMRFKSYSAAALSDTTTSSSSSSSYQQDYILIGLAGFTSICLGLFSANVILPLADDMNRRVYQNMRLHGCSAAAYWIGTLLYDIMSGTMIVVAYVIGAYARPISQLQNEILGFQCVILFLTIVNVLFMAYCVVLLLPVGTQPNVYIYAVCGGYYLTVLIPKLVDVALSVTGKVVPVEVVTITPGISLFSAVIVNPTTPAGVWSTQLAQRCFISCTLWNIPWMLILLHQAYISPRFQLFSSGKSKYPTAEDPFAKGAGNGGEATTPAPDRDVAVEETRIESDPSGEMVATQHLRQVFAAAQTSGSDDRERSVCEELFAAKIDKIAVENLTFGVHPGECFGLLGPNGAGKTTTVKMLMRESCPTFGAVLFPYDKEASDINAGLLGSIDHAYKHARLGCCQQVDTLWDNLTAREHMEVYLRCRLGPRYDPARWSSYIDKALEKVELLADTQGKEVEAFSGGMKRKLCVCIAMFTGARLSFLDEPSTGMDPYARRALWRAIGSAIDEDRSVVLTTHSMEEADAVCARISIMTQGVMRCIGSSQHLKNRFGTGYMIVLTLQARDRNGKIQDDEVGEQRSDGVAKANASSHHHHLLVEDPATIEQNNLHGLFVDNDMKCVFGATCGVKEVLGLQRRYAVTELQSLSFAFQQLEMRKSQWGVSNYSVQQQSSLEQIFLNFAGRTI